MLWQTHSKRKYGRQRPEKSDFTSEEEFLLAFQRWRERRDKNNKAVGSSSLVSTSISVNISGSILYYRGLPIPGTAVAQQCGKGIRLISALLLSTCLLSTVTCSWPKRFLIFNVRMARRVEFPLFAYHLFPNIIILYWCFHKFNVRLMWSILHFVCLEHANKRS
jgi:hypothetical protein